MISKKTDLSRLIKGVSFSWLRFILTISIGIVQTPLLFKYLNNEELNFWYIFFLFGAFLQMADLGLVQTISRLVAYIDNSDTNTDEKIIGNLSGYSVKQIYITALFSFFNVLLLIGIVVFGVYFFLYDHGTNYSTLNVAFSIYIVGMLFSLMSNIPAAMLIGYRDIAVDSVGRSVAQVIYFILLFSLLPHYQSIILVSFVFMLQNIGQFIGLHYAFYKRHKHIFILDSTREQLIKFDIAKQIYSQSFPLVLNQLGAWLISQGNVFIASIVVGADKISDYSINQQLFTYTIAIALVINQLIGPYIAKQHIQNKFDSLQGLFSNVMIICLSIVSVLIIVLISCGENIIALWVGRTHFLGYQFAFVFAVIAFLEVQQSVTGNFVWNTGSWPFNKWTLGAGILTVTLGYVLGKQYGLFGIAVATLVSKLITLNWYVMYFGLKRLSITVSKYTSRTLSPLLLSLGVSLSTAMLVKRQSLIEGFGDLITTLLVSVVSGGLFLLFISILFRKSIIVLYETIILPKLKPKL